ELVEEGKFSLNTTLRQLEDKYPSIYRGALTHFPNSNSIFLSQLLSHTSGIIDYMSSPRFYKNWAQTLPPEQIIALMAQDQPEFQPGSVTLYSNTALLILGRLVEEATGDSLVNQTAKRIFQQIDLRHTYFATQATGWGNVHGYELLQSSEATQSYTE